MIACISHHPPPLPHLSISIRGFECVLYARALLSRLCALSLPPHSHAHVCCVWLNMHTNNNDYPHPPLQSESDTGI